FGAMAAPVVFRSLEEADPTLPTVLSVNLDRQHAALLAMTVNTQLWARLAWVQLVCAGGLLVAIVVQWALLGGGDKAVTVGLIRSVLYVAAVGLLVYGWRVVWPRTAGHRRAYVENADDPEVALPARDQLMRSYREGEVVQLVLATVLSALILFSAGMHRTVTVYTNG
ncbi:MAG: hypothetical protein JWO31_214, partial [Phycisphaerales bacterium]|nr:hypothetical protein [Phycisphaerales bacterium]